MTCTIGRVTITVGAPPTHDTPADFALGFLTGGVIGASLTAFISGCVVEKTWLIVMGLVLPAIYGLVLLFTLPRRAREAAVVPRTALAVIESLEAVDGETRWSSIRRTGRGRCGS